jgi:beta-glucosidase
MNWLFSRQKHRAPALLALTFTVTACSQPPATQTPEAQAPASAIWPQLKVPAADAALELKINSLLAEMTLAQKVAQVIQPDIRWMSVADMRQYGFGSYLNGGGAYPNDNKQASAADWAALADAYTKAAVDASLDGSTIPPLWGTDAVHGHNNVYGATIFPHNIGLGAANNATLVQAIGKATATEVAATGIDWLFAPTVAVARDDRWGRSYESYSEDPAIVRSLGAALVRGIQGEPATLPKTRIATAKHYLGDGGTDAGKDQGNNSLSEAELVRLHAQGYFSAIEAGVQTVMASFNSWQGQKMHGSQYLLTDVLKTRLGFDGIVVGDWNGHGQLPGCSNQHCAAAFNAGVDILMVPEDWKALYQNTIADIESGAIPQARLDDAVRRILRVKFRAGLFQQDPSRQAYKGQQQWIGHPDHQALAAQAVRESLVLLKNNGRLLPLAPKQRLLVAGDGADNIGKQSGGWTVTWQGTGTQNSDFPQGSSILTGIRRQVEAGGGSVTYSADGSFNPAQKPDLAIVVIGENPYAEFDGDITTLDYQSGSNADEQMLRRLKAAGIQVVTVFLSGRPLWVNPELNLSDAFVAAWLPGSAGQAVAEVLFQTPNGKVQYDFKGKLPFSWPKQADQSPLNSGDTIYQPLFALGYGLSYSSQDATQDIAADLPEQVAQQAKATTQRSLLERRPAAGLTLQLQDQQGTVAVSGNKAASPSQQLQLQAVNWQKQEDALQLQWQGDASLVLHSTEALDISAYGQLVFDLKWQTAPQAPLLLGMSCGSGCGGTVNLNPLLTQKAAGQWHKLVIDLQCLANAGVALNHLFQPFLLQSSGNTALTLSNIRLTPATATADLSCPGA